MSESWRDDNDNEPVDGASASSGEGHIDAAEILRTAREKAGLSQKEVAEQLYLTERFIRHIDEGAFDKITKPAFIKGYLRSYARVVNVSGDEVVEGYQRSLDEAEQSIELRSVSEDSLGSSNFTGPVIQTGLAGLAGLLLFIGFIWWLVADKPDEVAEAAADDQPVVEESLGTEPTPAVREEPVAMGRVEDAEPIADEMPREEPVTDDTPESKLLAETIDSVTEEPESAAVPTFGADEPSDEQRAVTVARSVTDAGNNRVTVNAGGDDSIVMTFSDECWVEITDAGGTSIYGDLSREGDELMVYGVAPFQVLLGRATSVAMRFNGESIELDAYTTVDQTARIRLEN